MRSMRWQVEMTPIGKTEAQSVIVEAESWQKALQGARHLRGEIYEVRAVSEHATEAAAAGSRGES
jgi:hypothetical protein